MNIVFIGIQGSGKGTLVSNLENHIDFKLISVGLLLRQEVLTGSELGKHIHELQMSGSLVENEIVLSVLKKNLNSNDKPYLIFDGFPRTLSQAKELDKICSVDKVIYLKLTKDIALERLLNRLTCKKCGFVSSKDKHQTCPNCGGEMAQRADDTIEAINERFKLFKNETMPILKFYQDRGVLFEVDANQTSEEVCNSVLRLIK